MGDQIINNESRDDRESIVFPELQRVLDAQFQQNSRATYPGQPIFILCTSRSGSTLLRLLLNNHPDIACPAETSFPQILNSLELTWTECGEEFSGVLSETAQRAIRKAARAPLEVFAKKRGKALWCDKTLSNATSANLIHKYFPRARFICVYRNCMDMVHSGLQASPWGFDAYGFEPFVRNSLTNSVAAVSNYWYVTTSAIKEFQQLHPKQSFALHYEALVARPEETLEGLLEYLGLPWSEEVLRPDRIGPVTFGLGDHKARFTSEINSNAVGEGQKVPVGLIPADLLERINLLMDQLSYPPITSSWNRQPSRLKSYGNETTPTEAENEGALILSMINDGLLGRDSNSELWVSEQFVRLGIVLEDGTSNPRQIVVDFAEGSAFMELDSLESKVEMIMLGSSFCIIKIARGELNMGEAFRSGELRLERVESEDSFHKDGFATVRRLRDVLILGNRVVYEENIG